MSTTEQAAISNEAEADRQQTGDVADLEAMFDDSDVILPERFAGAVRERVEESLDGLKFTTENLPEGSSVDFVPKNEGSNRHSDGRLSLLVGEGGEVAFSIYGLNETGNPILETGKISHSGADSWGITDYSESELGRAVDKSVRSRQARTRGSSPHVVGEKEITIMRKLDGFLSSKDHKVRFSTVE